MKAHRRQFILGPQPIEPVTGWASIRLHRTCYLSHCPELGVATATDRGGTVWHLIGLAIQTDENRPDPSDDIAAADSSAIGEKYKSWAGRWILIGNGVVHTDAAGLLGCFYHVRESSGGKKEVWASSSAALLSEMFRCERDGARVLGHGIGMDWYPPPRSRFTRVSRLLPSQVLDLTTGEPSARRLLPRIEAPLDFAQSLERVRTYLVTALRGAARISSRLWLPLTAGLDSRLLLATAHHAGVTVRAYTHSNRYINDADLNLPPRLAAAVGVEHTIFHPTRIDAERTALHDTHTSGHHVGQDRDYIARDQFRWCRKGDLILRGGCFEIGRCHYWKRFPGAGVVVAPPGVEEIARAFGERLDPSFVDALDQWVAWTRWTPHPEMDWRDRFYLEQRLSGWLSSVEQSLDLIAAERFVAANSQAYFAQVLRIPEQNRRQSQHHRDLIRMMAPALAEFPVNPPPRFHKKAMSRISRVYAQRVRRAHNV